MRAIEAELIIPPKASKKAKRSTPKPQAKPAPKSATRKHASTASARRDLIVKTLDKMKAEDINSLHVGDTCSFADYMVVATGRSQRHVASLADDVVRALRAKGMRVMAVEGQQTADWVLIDAGDVVVHIFRPETRQFYSLEKMWALPAPTRP